MQNLSTNAAAEGRNPLLNDLFLLFTGVALGVSSQFDAVFFPLDKPGLAELSLRVLLAFAGIPLLFFLLRRYFRKVQRSFPLHASERYRRYDTLTYAVFLLPVLGLSEFRLTPLTGYGVLVLFLGAQLFLVAFSLGEQRKELFHSLWLVPATFQISGFCALIYQVVWQRVLFAEFGVNIESITIVVSVFMFGLGLGSLAGGYLSRRYPAKLPHLFMACEVLTGVFGLFSLQLIRLAGEMSSDGSLLSTSQVIFALLFIPTLLMGATLPLLVTFLFRRFQHIGESVGVLYFINTLGAAIGCFVTTDLLFALFGKQGSVYIAACGNLLIGFLIYRYTMNNPLASAGETETPGREEGSPGGKCRFPLILFLSCVTGYVSLSQEILWFRAISYISGGKPVVFGHVLGIFLLGIAFGSLAGKKVCRSRRNLSLAYIATMLTLSSVLYYLSMPLISRWLLVSDASGMQAAYLLVGVVSFLMGGIFPVLCHEGITSRLSIGLPMSWIYFANIVGATAGPLVTGFLLLDLYPMEQIVLYLSMFMLLVAAAVFLISPMKVYWKGTVTAGIVLAGFAMSSGYQDLYPGLLEKFQFKGAYRKHNGYKYQVQNRSGILAVEPGAIDTIYGGGMYDGKFSTDPVKDANGITRAYMIAALHPEPAEVLEIGLSSGSWAKAISSHRKVRNLTIVEINPGYLELIRNYPEISSILQDTKVDIVIDDGRRWLNANPDAKFDFIVMNTSFHWRDGMTNLLSREFQLLCKKHLKKGGVIYYNTTGSEDAVFTAANTFNHIARFSNFVAASDSPFSMTQAEREANFLEFMDDSGAPFFLEGERVGILKGLVSHDLTDKADEYRRKKQLRVITDDNMATEFKKISW